MKKTIYIIIFSFCLSSCITNKDLEYLSTDSDIKKSSIVLNSYRLQKGDLLSIQISSTTEQEHDFFNKETTANSQLLIRNPYLYGYLIKDDGKLELPSFGNVQASGYTLRELESIIKNIAVSYFDEPVVKINIINLKSKKKFKQGRISTKSGYKKAIVTLKKGQSIDLTSGV